MPINCREVSMERGIHMEERRKSKRLELESKIIIKRLDGGRGEEESIEVIDVSKTGVGFNCTRALTIGAVYEAYLTIWTKEVIHAFVEIVRIEKAENTIVYGGVFIGMPEVDSQRISVYETVSAENEKRDAK